MQSYVNKRLWLLAVLLCGWVCPGGGFADIRALESVAPAAGIDRIISIDARNEAGHTAVTIRANGKIGEYAFKRYEKPSRVVVDVSCAPVQHNPLIKSFDDPRLKSARVDYHPDKIRVWLEMHGDDMPKTGVRVVGELMTIVVKTPKAPSPTAMTDAPTAGKRGVSVTPKPTPPSATAALPDRTAGVSGDGSGKPSASPTAPRASRRIIPRKLRNPALKTKNRHRLNVAAIESVPAASGRNAAPPMEVSESPAAGHPAPVNTDAVSGSSSETPLPVADETESVSAERTPTERALTRPVDDDGRPETALFNEALLRFKEYEWPGAIEQLAALIQTYPRGTTVEKASFLLAEARARQHANSLAANFKDVRNGYEEAINRWHASPYKADAFWGLSEMHFQLKNYPEALGYANLVLQHEKDSPLAIRALTRKVNIFLLLDKYEQAGTAMTTLEEMVKNRPEAGELIEIDILKAQLSYARNDFEASLHTLKKLTADSPEAIYTNPEIALYFGYNYYQLGDLAKARENLFRYYNSKPDDKNSDLVLAQVGDIYNKEGALKAAVKIYKMVLEHYPGTEGAIVCKIRLAESLEDKGDIADIGVDIGSAQEIYEDIETNSAEVDARNPLKQISLLKLALVHQKKQNYVKSFAMLKAYIEKFPLTSLKSEWSSAMEKAVYGIITDELDQNRYHRVVNFYTREERIFSMLNSPELYLPVADALLQLNITDMAVDVFKKADHLLPDDQKTAPLLYFTGRDYFRNQEFNKAEERFDLLLKKYPSHEYTFRVYGLMAELFVRKKQYRAAADMFNLALGDTTLACDRARLLTEKAAALVAGRMNDRAAAVIGAARDAADDCSELSHTVRGKIGDVYVDLGRIEDAIAVYTRGIGIATEPADRAALQLKLAEGYERLRRYDDALAVYDELSKTDDSFWHGLALEKIAQLNFKREIIAQTSVRKKEESVLR